MEKEVQIYVERGTEARSKGEENSSGWKFPCVELGASRPVRSMRYRAIFPRWHIHSEIEKEKTESVKRQDNDKTERKRGKSYRG